MRVLVTEVLSEKGIEKLRACCEVDELINLPANLLLERIREYDALLVRSQTKVTADVIKAGTRLKAIGRAGVGVDNIDVTAATERGVMVFNAADGNTISAAEHTIGLMIALARNIPQGNASLKQGKWERSKLMGVELFEKTLGVIGLGRIGQEVAKRAKAFGMRVMAYDPYVPEDRAEALGVELTTLNQLLIESDFVTLHVPKTDETKKLIGAAELAAMKPGARLINCARGGLIDEVALYEALSTGKLAGAALDVFEKEPPPEGSPLLTLDNLIVTPHLGASTYEAQDKSAEIVIDQVIRALRGERVATAINVPAPPPAEIEGFDAYLRLAEVLGQFLSQALPIRAAAVEVTYSGEISQYPVTLLTNTMLKGIMEGTVSEPVNYINAPILAKKRGIRVVEKKSGEGCEYTNLISLEVKSNGDKRKVAGMITQDQEVRLVSVDGYKLDFTVARHMLLVRHVDRPGMIGKVSTMVGNKEINIASMQVGRKNAGLENLMVLQIDEEAPQELLEEIARIPGVTEVRKVLIPSA